jgi:hypothetical protein
MTMPPAGAGFVTVSVATELFPPTTLDGAKVMLFGETRLISTVVVMPEPSASAEIATAMSLFTIDVCTGKVAVNAPAGTVTVDGTTTCALLDARFTTWPPTPAELARVTVATAASPPMMAVGATVSDFGYGTSTYTVPCTSWPPTLAVITALVSVETVFAVTGNVAVSAPTGTVTEAGTETAGELLSNITTTPPTGASRDNLTVPTPAFVENKVVGATVTVETLTPTRTTSRVDSLPA